MEIGIGIPCAPDGPGVKRFARRAEDLGFQSVLLGDHVVLPTAGTRQYPYTADGSFRRPAGEPYLEAMTLLGYLAACTETIRIGSTVVILPYRNPVVAGQDVCFIGRIDQRPYYLRRGGRLAGEGI